MVHYEVAISEAVSAESFYSREHHSSHCTHLTKHYLTVFERSHSHHDHHICIERSIVGSTLMSKHTASTSLFTANSAARSGASITSPIASGDNLTTKSYGAIPLTKSRLNGRDGDADAAAGTPKHHDPARRSQVAHSLLHKQDDLEAQLIPASASLRVQLAINASLGINVVLAIAKLYAAIISGSLAVLSSLVDSILDLTSQALFWYSDKRMHTPSVKYPAGRRRLEPIAVIISATLMGMAGRQPATRGDSRWAYFLSIVSATLNVDGSLVQLLKSCKSPWKR